MTSRHECQVWLHDPFGVGDYFEVISAQLRHADIRCHACRQPNDKKNVLFLLDDRVSAEAESEYLRTLLDPERHVIALYTGEKKLPFYRAWRLLGMGVDDVFQWQSQNALGETLAARLNRWAYIEDMLTSERVQNVLIGSSPVWRNALRQIIETACFSTAPVLVLGESGTGKELAARLIHDLDKRPDKQGLVLLDCTTVVPELSGSEFFGHEKGAFTNALEARDGAFALADRGTLFLDEVGELPLRLQAELLRVSQEGAYKRVGGNLWKKAQFRLICATNRNLTEEIEKGRFREDLYYRLSASVIRLPPLRERRLDIPELAAHFLAQQLKTDAPPDFDPLMMNYLLSRPYPGNVRQLRQLITRIATRCVGKQNVTLGDLPAADRESFALADYAWQENGFKDAIRRAVADGVGLKEIKRIAADTAMDIAVEEAAGNLQEAARRLDVTDRLVQGYWAGKRNGEGKDQGEG
jgi:transcriptional regulator with GAF, ATPase, and Fis domain